MARIVVTDDSKGHLSVVLGGFGSLLMAERDCVVQPFGCLGSFALTAPALVQRARTTPDIATQRSTIIEHCLYDILPNSITLKCCVLSLHYYSFFNLFNL
jgi:hypothetical protein